MKAKRMGRPPLAKAHRKGARLSVRLTKDELRAVERAAKGVCLAVSDWVRAAVLAASSSPSEALGTSPTPPSERPSRDRQPEEDAEPRETVAASR